MRNFRHDVPFCEAPEDALHYSTASLIGLGVCLIGVLSLVMLSAILWGALR